MRSGRWSGQGRSFGLAAESTRKSSVTNTVYASRGPAPFAIMDGECFCRSFLVSRRGKAKEVQCLNT